MFYLIHESLAPCTLDEAVSVSGDVPFVAVLSGSKWKELIGTLGIEIDIEMDEDAPHETKVVVNRNSLTGTFSIPDRQKISGPRHTFSFALNERGVALVSGCTPRLFSMVAGGNLSPYAVMMEVLESERYASIMA